MPKFVACAAVLAGGRSARMGQDKALLSLDGRPLLQRVVEALSDWFAGVMVVTNHPERYPFLQVPIAGDRVLGAGPLAGIEAALAAAQWPLVYLMACDMPFLDRAAIGYLLRRARRADAAVPLVNGEWEPLCAVYQRTCLPAVTAALDRGDRRMISFFPDVRIARVGAAQLGRLADVRQLLFNMNTPADWDAAQQMWRNRSGGLARHR